MPAKKSFLLRLSHEMWRELERWANDEFRSVNGQIESILHEAIARRRGKEAPGPGPGGTSTPREET
ncbi:MAG: Arc family DNA-binding protein [Candidatus Aminicenantes bacterium]|nr:Arc family DNA-binding protein [Candidatus Aminicenantes bacterium]